MLFVEGEHRALAWTEAGNPGSGVDEVRTLHGLIGELIRCRGRAVERHPDVHHRVKRLRAAASVVSSARGGPLVSGREEEFLPALYFLPSASAFSLAALKAAALAAA